jgi:plastocyanin domain-containing protein
MNIIATSISVVVSILAMGDMQSPSKDLSFRPIEQPWLVRVGVVLGGLTLVGAELWWFLGRKQEQQQAKQRDGVQECDC